MMRALAIVALAALAVAQEPDLPIGLGRSQDPEPGLPAGLEQEPKKAAEPGLPSGLGGTEGQAMEIATGTRQSLAQRFGLTGFLDMRAGVRTQRDPYERDAALGETRLRLETERDYDAFVVRLSGDLLADTLMHSWQPELERGAGFFDLREANASASPWPWADVKVGRQVLTWGTGDLLFINDLFPKDWVSFFTGRDTEYLKAPSDAVRVGLFSDLANLEIVYTPRFDPDRFLTGERVSFYNPALSRRSGRDAVLNPVVADRWFDDDEISARLSRNVGGFELAAYGYHGRWKSPAGADAGSGRAIFPRLSVIGASARAQVGGGIANAEVGYYDSRQDRNGSDPLIDNSQLRALVGFERDLPEIAHSLTVGLQYYVEAMQDHDAYLSSLPGGMPARDEVRQVVTARVTKLLLDQRLRLSLFGYFSPSDRDMYLRPSVRYTIDDAWSVSLGANVFAGDEQHTFFGQFENNTNVWAALRMSF